MRLLLIAIGTRGDVQPYVALGHRLLRSGHDVRVAAHDRFSSLVTDHGLSFSPVSGDPQALLRSEAGQRFVHGSGTGLTRAFRLGMRVVADEIERGVGDVHRAARDADVLLTSPLGVAAAHPVAEARGVPLLRAFYAPATPTVQEPAFRLPAGIELGRRFNLATHAWRRQLMWLMARPTMNRRCRAPLGLPPLSLRDPMIDIDRRRHPVIYGYSEVIVPRPADWPPHVHVTGYWTLPQQANPPVPARLADFLAAGDPPVFVGFGSMPGFDADRLVDMTVRAARIAGRRAVLQLADAPGQQVTGGSDEVLIINGAPHQWLFDRVAGVVTHGGSGTVAAALTAGRPTQVVPFLLDQHLWAERTAALGAGPAPIPPREVTAERLADAMTELATNSWMRAVARSIGNRLRAEDGVGAAVAVLEDFFGRAAAGRAVPASPASHPGRMSGDDPTAQREQAMNPQRVDLSLAEELFLGLDSPAEPGTMHLEIRVAGSLDPARLEQATRTAASRHPMTRVGLATGRRFLRPPQWEFGAPAPAVLVRTRGCDADGDMPAIRSDFYSRAIDPAAAPLLRLLLVQRPGGDSLLLGVHHAVMDGLGMARFLQSVGRAYADLPDPVPAVDPVATRDLAAAFGDRYPRSERGQAFRRTRGRRRSQLQPQAAAPGPGYGFLHFTLPRDWPTPDASHRDLRGARGDYLMTAALHRAVEAWNAARGTSCDLISSILPVSVRPPEWGLEVVANLVMAGHVFTTPEQRATDEELLKAVTGQVRAIKEGDDFGAALHTPAWVRKIVVPALMTFGGKRLVDAAAIMTNVGPADGVYDFGAAAGEIIESWGSPPALMPMGLGICTGTLYGDVLITMRYCRALFDDAAAADFGALYLEGLERLSLQQRRGPARRPVEPAASSPE